MGSRAKKDKLSGPQLLNKIREDEKCKFDMFEVQIVFSHLEDENNDLKKLVMEQKEAIEAIKAQNTKLTKDIEELRKRDVEAIKTKNTQLSNDIKEMKEGNKKMADKMAKDNKDVKEHSYKKAYQAENKTIASHLILKNVVMDGDDEDNGQTKEIVNEILADLGVDNSVKVTEVTRFTKSNKSTGNRPPAIRVKFATPGMKKKIFQKVSSLKNSDRFSRISVQNEYPSIVRKQYQRKEKQAFGIRKKSKNTIKTRIEIKECRPVLTVMGPEDQDFRPPEEEEFLQEEENEEEEVATTSKGGGGKKDSKGKAKNGNKATNA